MYNRSHHLKYRDYYLRKFRERYAAKGKADATFWRVNHKEEIKERNKKYAEYGRLYMKWKVGKGPKPRMRDGVLTFWSTKAPEWVELT